MADQQFRIVFIADNQKYLSRINRTTDYVEAFKQDLDAYSKFTLFSYEDGTIALKADNGKFLYCDANDNSRIKVGVSDSTDSRCKFTMQAQEEGMVAISFNNSWWAIAAVNDVNYIAATSPDQVSFTVNIEPVD
ncbi:fascin domain-containing protein [Sorangium sp. So ce1099]|uniref:fascin domain-containing protein n=1 Tax=Sorangium sp. So ce1099 TaxID=3133331 RepID=UPI003F5EA6C4